VMDGRRVWLVGLWLAVVVVAGGGAKHSAGGAVDSADGAKGE
jgi:hypothetical protein